MTWRPRALLIDLDGVVYQENRLIDGVDKTLAWIHDMNIPHLFLTNTSSKPRRAIVRKLADMGLAVDADGILTPAVAAMDWLNHNVVGPVALFVNDATREDFADIMQWRDSDPGGAAAVVLGDLGANWTFERLNQAFRLLMAENQPPLLALGMTRYWRTAGGLQLDVGAFVQALEYATGREAVVVGKPAGSFFHAALDSVRCSPENALMIGDDLVGDIHGAEAAGIRGALVRTGKFRPSDIEGESPPTLVLESLAGLRAWWDED